MARHWAGLVGVTPLVLGMLVVVPQMVVAPLVLAQGSSQGSQEAEALRLYREGERLRQQGTRESLQQALDKFQEALPLFRAMRYRSWEAATLNNMATVLSRLLQPQQALDFYQQALVIFKESGERNWEAAVLNNIGRVYADLRQPQQALNYYQQALPIFREVSDRSGEATLLANIEEANRLLGQSQGVAPSADVSSSQPSEGEQLYREGERLRQQGTRESLQQALNKFQQALTLFRATRNRRQEAVTLVNIGYVYQGISQPQRALEYYQQALPILREVNDRPVEATTLGNIGYVYISIGQPQRALEYYQQALPITREVNGRSGEANTLTGIGLVYDKIGQPQRALEYYQQALPILREVNDRSGEANTLTNIGAVYSSIGQPQRALEYYQQALPITREVNDRSGEATTLNNIGYVYSSIDQPQRALEYYQQALPITREVNNRSVEATILNNIGTVYSSIDQPQRALEYYQQSLPILREVNNRPMEATTLTNIGSVYGDIGQPQRALEYYQQALPIRREVNNRSGEAVTLYNLAIVQRTLNNLPAALENIQSATQILETIRSNLINPDDRTTYFASVQRYYKFQIDLLMQLHQQNPNQGYNIQAFNTTERSKARTLLELLTESKADIRNGIDPQLLQQEKDLQAQLDALDKRRIELGSPNANNRQQIATLDQQRQTLQTQYQELQTKIRATSPKYAALKYPEPLTLEQIQQQILDDNTLILSYSLGENQSYLWLISKTEMTSYELPKQKTIEDLFNKKIRPQFTNRAPSRDNFFIDTSEVSNILLKPVIEKLGNKRLVIISDGALQFLSFSALPDPRVSDKYQPLLVNNEVDYLPSATTLQTIRNETPKRTPAPRTVAILADPVFSAGDPRVNRSAVPTATPNEIRLAAQTQATATRDARGGDWNRLSNTRQEAETILKLFPPDSSLSFFDFQANRANAQSSQLVQYRFIHWATHGFFNPQKPELSGIVMSLVQENGQPQDGYLLLGDIFNLNLNADLVVLSACETGLGEVLQGEGLIGLNRGLMYAGTPRVVTSLWTVPDRQTALLMGKFYEKMLQQNLRPAEALRAAQLEIFQTQSTWSPFHWAAFTLQGEWR